MSGNGSDPRRSLVLGIDTGGTSTDAVLVEADGGEVVAAAKCATTHGDLSLGIGQVTSTVLGRQSSAAAKIDRVALSTTLATNALVEGRARSVALITIGFDDADLDRILAVSQVTPSFEARIDGGHDSHGAEQMPLDEAEVRTALDALPDEVAAVAIVGRFAVRNSSHELTVAQLVAEVTDRPVSCSHQLSNQLDGPKRAATALLNAGLVPIVTDVLAMVERALDHHGIDAPLLVVRGDGSAVSAAFARAHPIETLISGPAASVMGARHLARLDDALIVDMGGTSTDIALLRSGTVEIGAAGGQIADHHTMVRAIEVTSVGLGADSHIGVDDGRRLVVRPQAVRSLADAAHLHGGAVLDALTRQLDHERGRTTDATLVLPGPMWPAQPQDQPSETPATLAPLVEGSWPLLSLNEVAQSGRDRRDLDELCRHRVVELAGFTSTDAAVLLGLHHDLDDQASRLGAMLLARQLGTASTDDDPALAVARRASELVQRRSAEALLSSLLGADGLPRDEVSGALVQRALDSRVRGADTEALRLDVGSALPLVGVGGASRHVHRGVAELLGCAFVEVPHAEVAGAVGAAVAELRLVGAVTVGAPRRGLFRVHHGSEPLTVYSLKQAKSIAEERLTGDLLAQAAMAGIPSPVLTVSWDEKWAEVAGRQLFVEAELTITARPASAT